MCILFPDYTLECRKTRQRDVGIQVCYFLWAEYSLVSLARLLAGSSRCSQIRCSQRDMRDHGLHVYESDSVLQEDIRKRHSVLRLDARTRQVHSIHNVQHDRQVLIWEHLL